MNISINVKELENLLDATPATHNIMLTGRHGNNIDWKQSEAPAAGVNEEAEDEA